MSKPILPREIWFNVALDGHTTMHECRADAIDYISHIAEGDYVLGPFEIVAKKKSVRR